MLSYSAERTKIILLQYHFMTSFFCNTVFEQTWHFGGFKDQQKSPHKYDWYDRKESELKNSTKENGKRNLL